MTIETEGASLSYSLPFVISGPLMEKPYCMSVVGTAVESSARKMNVITIITHL